MSADALSKNLEERGIFVGDGLVVDRPRIFAHSLAWGFEYRCTVTHVTTNLKLVLNYVLILCDLRSHTCRVATVRIFVQAAIMRKYYDLMFRWVAMKTWWVVLGDQRVLVMIMKKVMLHILTHSSTKHDLITYLTIRYVIRYVIKCEKTRFSTLLHSQSPMGNDKPFFGLLLHIVTHFYTHCYTQQQCVTVCNNKEKVSKSHGERQAGVQCYYTLLHTVTHFFKPCRTEVFNAFQPLRASHKAPLNLKNMLKFLVSR